MLELQAFIIQRAVSFENFVLKLSLFRFLCEMKSGKWKRFWRWENMYRLYIDRRTQITMLYP